jgi:Holliday junction resolvasome RuvABC endonuclease subunit
VRILGVDGSLTCTGLAVVDTDDAGVRDALLGSGTIRTRTDDDDTDRCETIATGVVAIARRYEVDLVALEMSFVDPRRNYQVALRLKGLRSVVEGALRNAGILFVGVAPASRLKAVGINGKDLDRKAIKAATVEHVARRVGVVVGNDEADAYCVAKAGMAKWRKGQRQAEQLALGIPPGRRAAKCKQRD